MLDNFSDISDASGFDVADDAGAIIKVIGVGGGGGNAVNYMYKQNIPLIKFVVCNTDKQALGKCEVPNKVLLGYEITGGLGAGNIPEVGRQCAECDLEAIRALFSDETQMVFITSGMGGGTGTGAGPVIAREAKAAGMLTIGIVTIPFMFEGKKKIIKAIAGAEEMKKYVDALLIINNENLLELYSDLNFFNAFSKADETLANAARSISEIISEPLYVNVDFQDVKTTLKESGSAIISTAEGEGEHRITEALQKALYSPLMKQHDIMTSKRLLLKFVCSKDSENAIQAREIAEITDFTNRLPSSIDVKWGIGDDPNMGDKVKITVLASGFDITIKDGEESERIVIRDTPDTNAAAAARHEAEEEKKIEEMYGRTKVKEQDREAARMKYAVLKPWQFDDHEVIALIERTPTFTRPPQITEELRKISKDRNTPKQPVQTAAEPGTNSIYFG